MNYLPVKLTKLRKHYQFSQDFVAQILGIDTVEYMGVENGRSLLNYNQMLKLAQLYQIDVIEIFRNSEEVTLHDITSDNNSKNLDYFFNQDKLSYRIKKYLIKHKLIVFILAVLVVCLIVGIKNIIDEANKPLVFNVDSGYELAVSDKSLVYLSNGSAYTSKNEKLEVENVVKVANGNNFTAVLKDDGTVSVWGLNEDLSKQKDIVDISASNTHLLLLNKKGKVFAYGDNSNGQCAVKDYKNIKKIYAFEKVSVLLDEEGNIYYTSDILGSSKIKDYKNIKDIDVSNNITVIIKENGDVEYFAKKDTFKNITGTSKVVKVVCGDNFIACLKADGSVISSGLNSDDSLIVSKWQNIKALEAQGDFLIGLNEKINGVGNDESGLFVKEIIMKKLNQVSNVTYTISKEEVSITFDEVEHAKGYRVSLLGSDIAHLVYGNNVSFLSENFKDGNTYQIEITTLGNETEGYQNSDPLVCFVEYQTPKEK